MTGIFVSYRRSGASAVTYRLVDELQRVFGDDSIFLDEESIEPGLPFAEVILKSLKRCSAVLVVIGPQWIEMTDASGNKRLDNPEDWVHQEIKLAMASKLRVIPVLVQGAEMPEADQLPEALKAFSALQAFSISDSETHWSFDVSRLVDKLCRTDPKLDRIANRDTGAKPSHRRNYKIITGLAIILIVALTSIIEGWADEDEILGVIIVLGIAIALCYLGYREIQWQRLRAKLAAIAGMAVGGLTLISSLISYTFYEAFHSYNDYPMPAAVQNIVNPATMTTHQSTSALNISGIWVNDQGVKYQIVQTGNNISFTEYNAFGVQVGQGAGQLAGANTFHFQYYNSFLGMNANGTANINNNVMNMTFIEPMTGQSISVAAYRQ